MKKIAKGVIKNNYYNCLRLLKIAIKKQKPGLTKQEIEWG